MQPFILFSLPRTGSTTLQRLLNCHPGIRCLFEPFNPTNLRHYASQADTMRRTMGMPATVQSLWTLCNGFKHVWHWDGFPFEDAPDLNRQLLVEMGCRIVWITRENQLRRAISGQISAQMQVWTPMTPADFARIREHRFGPLEIAKLREEMDKSRSADAWTEEQLRLHQVPYVHVRYEELFEGTAPVAERIERVQGLLEFLGVGRVREAERQAEMERLFDPAVSGFQNAEHYGEIPNIAEVERELGSDETGHAAAGA